jgi:hypothetical protein
VLQVVANDMGVPQAILETHPTLPNQRALMTTLVSHPAVMQYHLSAIHTVHRFLNSI